ncbi:unnamed protein product [Meloidogyne enterolobii]|uniref:Uncharacterized protein n=1 Tax=Meloidogyne enterolobii TaxID=390850 RepID=A0ACB0ZQW7_MELEN
MDLMLNKHLKLDISPLLLFVFVLTRQGFSRRFLYPNIQNVKFLVAFWIQQFNFIWVGEHFVLFLI